MGTGGHSSDPLCSVTVCRRLGVGGSPLPLQPLQVPRSVPGVGVCVRASAWPLPSPRGGVARESLRGGRRPSKCLCAFQAAQPAFTAGPCPAGRPDPGPALVLPHGAPSSGSLLLGEFGVPCTPAVAGRRGRARPSGGRRPRLRGRPAVLTAVPRRSGPGRRDGRAGQGRAGAAAHGGAAAAGPGGER